MPSSLDLGRTRRWSLQSIHGGKMEEHSKGHICQCLSRLLTFRRRATLTVSDGRRRTGEEFVEGVLSLAHGLEELNVRRGDVVAIAALNSEWYMEWLLAVAFVGAIPAPLNYRWSLEEARTAAELTSPVMLVVDDTCRRWASALKTPSVKFTAIIGEFPYIFDLNSSSTFDLKSRGPSRGLSGFSYLRAPKDVALICFTSGSTGRPKGVAISHISLIVQSLAKIAEVGYCPDDVYLHTAPLCHIGGLSSCLAVLMSGGCHVFYPRFDAKRTLIGIEQNQVTSFITVPAMMADLVSHTRQWDRWNGGESVTKILNGGGGLTSQLIKEAIHIFPNAKLISAYGMTEACSSLTFATLHDPTPTKYKRASQSCNEVTPELIGHQDRGSCVGKPPAHIELQIQHDFQNDALHGIGRIITRGPHVMIGYWGIISTSNSTEALYDWLDTGDIGRIDATGNLWLLGRSRGKIKSGGENIYPEEVESVLLQHPGVSNVVVIGIPDNRLTEMVVACVNIKDGWEWVDERNVHSLDPKVVSRATLRNFCQEKNTTRFKIPKHFIFWRKPLPLTSTGKVRRDVVRREAMNYMQLLPSSNL